MSIKALKFIKTLAKSATPYQSDRMVLRIIAEYTFDDSGACRIGQQAIADEAGLSIRTVRTSIQRMIENNTISRERGAGKHGGGRKMDTLAIVGFKCQQAEPSPAKRRHEPATVAASKISTNRQPATPRTGNRLPVPYKEVPYKSKRTSEVYHPGKNVLGSGVVVGGYPRGQGSADACLLYDGSDLDWRDADEALSAESLRSSPYSGKADRRVASPRRASKSPQDALTASFAAYYAAHPERWLEHIAEVPQ